MIGSTSRGETVLLPFAAMSFNPYAAPAAPQNQPEGPAPQGGGPMQWEATEIVGSSWNIVKEQAAPLVGSLLVLGIINLAIGKALDSVLSIPSPNTFDFRNFERLQEQLQQLQSLSIEKVAIKGLIQTVISAFFTAGFCRMHVAAARHEPVNFGDMFSGGDRFLQVLLLAAIEWVIKLNGPVGLIGGRFLDWTTLVVVQLLLLVPAIYITLALTPSNFLVVDKRLNAVDAIKESFRITSGQKGQIFLFWVLAVLLILGGALACCVGLLATVPIVQVGAAMIYVRLTGTPGNANQFSSYGGPPPGMPGGWGPPGGGYGGPPPGGFGGPPPGGNPYGAPGGGYGGPPPGGYGGPPPGGYGGPPPGGNPYGGPPPGGNPYGPPGGGNPYGPR